MQAVRPAGLPKDRRDVDDYRTDLTPNYPAETLTSEEEMAGSALWLWDYLR